MGEKENSDMGHHIFILSTLKLQAPHFPVDIEIVQLDRFQLLVIPSLIFRFVCHESNQFNLRFPQCVTPH